MFAPPLRNTSTKHCHILIVEDNVDGRESLCMLLTLLGYTVGVAADGAEGVRKALADHPDIAIVDIGLPKLNGYEVARAIRSALGAKMRLLAYTAHDEAEARETARAAGFDAHFVKPAGLQALLPWLQETAPS